MKFLGKSKADGSIVEGTVMIEGLESWIANEIGKTAVWPDSVEEVAEGVEDLRWNTQKREI